MRGLFSWFLNWRAVAGWREGDDGHVPEHDLNFCGKCATKEADVYVRTLNGPLLEISV